MREYSSLEIPSGFLAVDFFGWEDVEADGIDRMLRTSAAEGPDMSLRAVTCTKKLD